MADAAKDSGVDAMLAARRNRGAPIRYLTDAGGSLPEPDARKAFPTPGGWLVRIVMQTGLVALLVVGAFLVPSLISCSDRLGLSLGAFAGCASRSASERMTYLEREIQMRILGSGR